MRNGLRSLGPDHVTESCACLNCGKTLNRATPVNDVDGPYPGAITICVMCGHIMAFADDMSFRELTVEETLAVAGDPRVVDFNTLRALRLKPQ
jgi:hypothetical protein